jgi:hypothetical protein
MADAEATKVVKTLDDAVQAYRGEDRFCKAFEISAGTLKRWRGIWMPRPTCARLRYSPSALRREELGRHPRRVVLSVFG